MVEVGSGPGVKYFSGEEAVYFIKTSDVQSVA